MAWFEDILSPFVCVQFTSGTTGNPKGVTLSHHNLVNNAFNIGHRVGYDAEVFLKSILIPVNYHHCCKKQVHRICCSVPFYHCFGNVAGTLASLLHGASLLVPCPRLTWYDSHCVFLCVKNVWCWDDPSLKSDNFSFNGGDCVTAIEKEKCTSIYGIQW